MDKLIVVIMGPGNKNFIDMCLKSVSDADKVLYYTSITIRRKLPDELKDIDVYYNEWNELDKTTNGKCRNLYLKHLKENYPDDWCLVLDEDEVCEDIKTVKKFIQTAKPGVYAPKMRHFIGDLGHEDATQKIHSVPNRLFKISEADKYPLDSHPVLIPKTQKEYITTNCTTIWHLGHLPVEYMKYISKRYIEHADNSTIHPPEFLIKWRDAHLYGTYPKRQINVTEIPKIILDNFGIDFDELYFRERGKFEAKHYQDCIDWKNFFKPKNAIEFGCGIGQRVKILNDLGVGTIGVEKSGYAVTHSLDFIAMGDIIDYNLEGNFDLTIAYDVLEHIDYKNLDKAITTLKVFSTEHILVSIPYKGTPNCELDPTHIIKEDRDWWVKQFTDKGLIEVKVPDHFLFKEQLLIFRRKK